MPNSSPLYRRWPNEVRKKFLLLDHDLVNARHVEKQLVRAGMSVSLCQEARELPDLLRASRFDVLLIDLSWHSHVGTGFLTQLRQSWPQLTIVAMSAVDSQDLEHDAISRGADLFTCKPVHVWRLLEFVMGIEASRSFKGIIEGIDLLELLRFLQWNQSQLTLEVTSRGFPRAFIYVEAGNVVHADCGDLVGEPAVYRCCCFRGGIFYTLPWREPSRRTIYITNESLLLKAAGIRDDLLTRQASGVDQGVTGGVSVASTGIRRPWGRAALGKP
ncbi:MAG: response regulator [Deltaproteobacteria bacterium]|nr:response regulator [Deltaproteobacteria bacterium]